MLGKTVLLLLILVVAKPILANDHLVPPPCLSVENQEAMKLILTDEHVRPLVQYSAYNSFAPSQTVSIAN